MKCEMSRSLKAPARGRAVHAGQRKPQHRQDDHLINDSMISWKPQHRQDDKQKSQGQEFAEHAR
eukprot:1159341-Pelagomonas_calceolata.AAC.1